jgi:hypothetical protein
MEKYSREFGLCEAVANTAVWIYEMAGGPVGYQQCMELLQENMGHCPVVSGCEVYGPVPGFKPLSENSELDLALENGAYFVGTAGLINNHMPAVIGGFGSSLCSAIDVLFMHCTDYDFMVQHELN